MKDSLNKLTCYNAQATTVVLVTRRTAVLLKAERKREVNNQAWIIYETSVYAKIAFSLFSSLLFLDITDTLTMKSSTCATDFSHSPRRSREYLLSIRNKDMQYCKSTTKQWRRVREKSVLCFLSHHTAKTEQ